MISIFSLGTHSQTLSQAEFELNIFLSCVETSRTDECAGAGEGATAGVSRERGSGFLSACLWIVLFGQMLLFGLRLVDLLRSPSIHLPLQLFFLPAAEGENIRANSGRDQRARASTCLVLEIVVCAAGSSLKT